MPALCLMVLISSLAGGPEPSEAVGCEAGDAVAVAEGGSTDPGPPSTPDGDSWTTRRVGGDLFTLPEKRGDVYVLGAMGTDAALPEGYPGPTPPGAIELKRYPKARRAQVSSSADVDRGMNAGFWPLFYHIKERNIPMTAPVEIDYAGMTFDDPSSYDRWTMAFLYEGPDQGRLEDGKTVDVVDSKPMTVLSIGVKGPYGLRQMERAMPELREWLGAHPEWRIAGDPRSLAYNGPMRPRSLFWGEVQVPVRRVGADPSATTDEIQAPAGEAQERATGEDAKRTTSGS